MKVEFEHVKVYEARDNQDWGASWGYFTEEAEARQAVRENETQWTKGGVVPTWFKVVKGTLPPDWPSTKDSK